MVGIELPDAGLTGELPEALGALSSLAVLSLALNSLRGPLPAALLTGIGSLRRLVLSRNALSGVLPAAALAALPAIEEVYVDGNDFEGELGGASGADWSRPTTLQVLVASRNRLSGRLPEALGSLPALQTLELDQNELGGPVPQAWSGLVDSIVVSGSSEGIDLRFNADICGDVPAALAGVIEASVGTRVGSPCPTPVCITTQSPCWPLPT